MKRVTTLAALVTVALVAAVVSYAHMQQLAERAGEGWRSWLIPLSVDGLIVAASMVLLTSRKHWFAWVSLVTGVLVSLAANIAAVLPGAGLISVLVAGGAPVAFAACFHLLLGQWGLTTHRGLTSAEVVQLEELTRVPIDAPVTDRLSHDYVYRLLDQSGGLVYVGVTADLPTRLSLHCSDKDWWSEVASVQVTAYATRLDALTAERVAIATEDPRHNRAGVRQVRSDSPAALVLTPAPDPVEVSPVRPIAPNQSDQTLVTRLLDWSQSEGSVPSRERIRTTYRVGTKRAERLRLTALGQWSA